MSSYDVAAENDNAAVLGAVFVDAITFGYIQERVLHFFHSFMAHF